MEKTPDPFILLGRVERTLDPTALAFSPDDRVLVAGLPDGTIRAWSCETGKQICDFTGASRPALTFTFQDEGRTLVSVGADGSIRGWDLATGKLIGSGYPHRRESFVFTPSGNEYWHADGKLLVRNSVKRGSQSHYINADKKIDALGVSPDEKWLATSQRDEKTGDILAIWDVASGQKLAQVVTTMREIRHLAFSPNGRILAAGGYDRRIHLWQVNHNNAPNRLSLHEILPDEGPVADITGLQYSPDGERLLSGSSDGIGQVWETRSGKVRFRLSTNYVRGWLAKWAHGEIFTGDNGGGVQAWDAPTGRKGKAWANRSITSVIASLDVSPDGQSLAAVGRYPYVTLWNLSNGQSEEMPFAGEEADFVAFSNDGNWLIVQAVDRENTIRVLDRRAGKEVLHIAPTKKAIAISDDRKLLATGKYEKCLVVWDTTNGEQQQSITCPSEFLAAAFVPGGKFIVTGHKDHVARVWEIKTGRQREDCAGHRAAIHAVAVHPDGKQFATGSQDCQIFLWKLDTAACEASSRAALNEETRKNSPLGSH